MKGKSRDSHFSLQEQATAEVPPRGLVIPSCPWRHPNLLNFHFFAWLILFAVVIGLLIVYGFILTGNEDREFLLSTNSVLFDLDQVRVARELSTEKLNARNLMVHPLSKLLYFPVFSSINHFTEDKVVSGRILGLLSALTIFAATGLTAYFAGREPSSRRALIAMGIVATSIGTIITTAIFDLTSLSGLASIAPFALLYSRRNKPWTFYEAAAWCFLPVIGSGTTITQGVHSLAALTFRLSWSNFDDKAQRQKLARVFASAAALFIFLLILQSAIWQKASLSSVRVEELQADSTFVLRSPETTSPILRAPYLFFQMLVVPFVSPEPQISNIVWPAPTYHYHMISFANSIIPTWSAAQTIPLALFIILFLVPTAIFSARQIDTTLPLFISLLFNVVVHFMYGYEMILYSPNWICIMAVLLAVHCEGLLVQMKRQGRQIYQFGIAATLVMLLINNSMSFYKAVGMATPEALIVPTPTTSPTVPIR